MKVEEKEFTFSLSGTIKATADTEEEAFRHAYINLDGIQDAIGYQFQSVDVDLDIEKSTIIWGITSNKRGLTKVHAYLSEEDWEGGKCLCGAICNATLRMDNWKPNGTELAKDTTCPRCKELLKFLKFR